MLKKFGLLCLLMSNATNFSMSRQLTSRLPKTIQSYMPRSLTQAPKMDQPTTSISSQDLSKRVNELLQQKPEYAQTFENHPVYWKLEKSKELSPSLQMDFHNKNIILLHEILQYCYEHPQDTEDIMNFYTNMENADSMIKEKLAQQPEHFQRFFNQQLQLYINPRLQYYMQEQYQYTKADGSMWIKERILRYFDYPFIALKTCINIVQLMILILFCKQELRKLQGKNAGADIDNQNLSEAIELLQDALDIPNVPVKKQRPDSFLYPELSAVAFYDPSFNIIILNPLFFNYSIASQVRIILHEMRHGLQWNRKAELSPEILEYAKSCNLNLGWGFEKLCQQAFFWSTAIPGRFWSSPLKEFDADNFAYEHMKNSPIFKDIAQERDWHTFNPNKGYFSTEMALKKAPKMQPNSITTPEETLNGLYNPYLQHIPEHLAQAAAKNRTARAKLLAQQQNETLFDRYLKKLEAEDLIS